MAIESFVPSESACFQLYENISISGPTWCNVTWDQILCWPPTLPDLQVMLPCPPIKGVDTSEFAYRICDSNGEWKGKREWEQVGNKLIDNSSSSIFTTTPAPYTGGWSNYSKCFIPEMKDLLDRLYSNSEDDVKLKMQIASAGRIFETVGLCISLLSILVSLFIFANFRILRNHRTRIHWHLFTAIAIQLAVRLTVYIDQYAFKTPNDSNENSALGIENTAYLCEAFYILLEYARTAMFLWMFVEGIYLHSRITIDVFLDRPNYALYYTLGWGIPVILTSIWAVVMFYKYEETKCWWGYNLIGYYWILEGPRLAVIFTNFIFLLNILRVLITKLQATVPCERKKIRLAVKAAIILLPLLGITNSLVMVEAPIEGGVLSFAFWTFGTTFMTAFQGFFVTLIYCFLNIEVQTVLRKHWMNYHSRRSIELSRKHSSHLLKRNSSRRNETEINMISMTNVEETVAL